MRGRRVRRVGEGGAGFWSGAVKERWPRMGDLLLLVGIGANRERAFGLERPGIVVLESLARLRLVALHPLHGAYSSALPRVGEPAAPPARAGSGDVSDRHGVSTGSESLSRNPTKDAMSRFFIHLHDTATTARHAGTSQELDGDLSHPRKKDQH